jgi:hypothetical protein
MIGKAGLAKEAAIDRRTILAHWHPAIGQHASIVQRHEVGTILRVMMAATGAGPATGIAQHHPVTGGHVCDARAHGQHRAGAFVAQHLRQRCALFIPLHADIGETDAARRQLDQHLPRPGIGQLHSFDAVGLPSLAQHGSAR